MKRKQPVQTHAPTKRVAHKSRLRLSKLPFHLWKWILSCLDIQSIIACSQTCTTIRKLFHNPMFWNTSSPSLILNPKSIQQLHLDKQHDPGFHVNFTTVTGLFGTLKTWHKWFFGVSPFSYRYQVWTQLTNITLELNFMYKLSNGNSGLMQLTTIVDADLFTNTFRNLRRLKVFIPALYWGSAPFVRMISNLKHLTHVHVFIVDNARADEANDPMERFCNALPPTLVSLQITGCLLPNASLKHISNLKKLEVLNVNAGPDIASLLELNLVKLIYSGYEPITLVSCRTLQVVSLCNCSVTGRNLEMFLSSIPNLKSFDGIDLGITQSKSLKIESNSLLYLTLFVRSDEPISLELQTPLLEYLSVSSFNNVEFACKNLYSLHIASCNITNLDHILEHTKRSIRYGTHVILTT
jgi:hypothetical protein